MHQSTEQGMTLLQAAAIQARWISGFSKGKKKPHIFTSAEQVIYQGDELVQDGI